MTKKGWGNAAKKTIYKGKVYDSKFESEYAMILDSMLRSKKIKSWDRQIKIPVIINGVKVFSYTIDFSIIHNDGSIEYVETKGYATYVWRIKWKILNAIHSKIKGIKFTLISQNKISFK